MEKKLGIEIEFTGVTRREVVTALENLFHSVAEEVVSKSAQDGYIYHRIKDTDGGTWLVVRDRSIQPEVYAYKIGEESEDKRFTKMLLDKEKDSNYLVELVTPALTSKSLPILFTVVDIIKSLGGIVNSSCGLHVHIDKPNDLSDIVKLFFRFCSEQYDIYKYFKVESARLDRYCMPYKDYDCLDNTYTTIDEFLNALFKLNKTINAIDNEPALRIIRYHALNFYSLLQHNTIEFRLFNSTLDRTEIAKILDWVLHFVYTSDDYNSYIQVLGSIIANEINKNL